MSTEPHYPNPVPGCFLPVPRSADWLLCVASTEFNQWEALAGQRRVRRREGSEYLFLLPLLTLMKFRSDSVHSDYFPCHGGPLSVVPELTRHSLCPAPWGLALHTGLAAAVPPAPKWDPWVSPGVPTFVPFILGLGTTHRASVFQAATLYVSWDKPCLWMALIGRPLVLASREECNSSFLFEPQLTVVNISALRWII